MTSSHPPAIIDVFAYDDYRLLLGDYYVKKKELQPYFSYRAFSRRTGFRSPNHLQRVINGDRNLSSDASVRYSQAMHLDAEEQDYFCTLVEHGHASNGDERKRLSDKLLAMKRCRSAQRLKDAHRRSFYP